MSIVASVPPAHPELSDAEYRALGVMEMSRFAPEKRALINEQVEYDVPPPKWWPPLRMNPLTRFTPRAWFEWHVRRSGDPRKRRQKISPKMRAMVIERDGLICGICGDAVESQNIHIDHVVPRKHGGADGIANLQVTHSSCNLKKGATLP